MQHFSLCCVGLANQTHYNELTYFRSGHCVTMIWLGELQPQYWLSSDNAMPHLIIQLSTLIFFSKEPEMKCYVFSSRFSQITISMLLQECDHSFKGILSVMELCILGRPLTIHVSQVEWSNTIQSLHWNKHCHMIWYNAVNCFEMYADVHQFNIIERNTALQTVMVIPDKDCI